MVIFSYRAHSWAPSDPLSIEKKAQILKHLSNEISLFWVLYKYGVSLFACSMSTEVQ